jgi:hypothetical protein
MKTRTTPQYACLPGRVSFFGARTALVLLTLAAATSSIVAQTVTLRSQPLRFTIPQGVASSNAVVLTVPTSGLTTPLVNLAVTGVPGSGNAAATLSQSAITSNGTTTVTLVLTNDSSIVPGTYDLAVEATGDANYRLPVPMIVAYVWSGVDYTNAVSTNWTSAGNWRGGAVPGTTAHVVFRDGGGQAGAPGPTNITISANTEVSSLRFASEGSATRAHNLEIQSGANLLVSGPGLSFSLHRDTKQAGQPILATISGGGSLTVANPDAEIGVLIDNQQNATLDLRNLDNFSADVKRIGLGNHRIWPNVYTNGYTGEGTGIQNIPFRFVPLVWLAKTNLIKCSWVDPNNYNDPGIRDYAIEVGNDTASGTTANIRFTLGLSNAFFIDSICWSHAGKGGGGNNFNFNAAGSYALFRGIGGGRISVWAQGDASGQGLSGSNVRGTIVDFGNGQVDAAIDRLYLGRSRTNSNGFTIQGTLTIGGASPGSIFNVNTAILGYQDVLNLNPTPAQANSGPVGTINVNSNATLRVNGDLHLGYTTAAAPGLPDYPENCSGVLNINNSGTVLASNILAGGVTKLSVLNNISVNNSGVLVVTNKLGDSTARINNLTLANNAQLTLRGVALGQTTVYVRTFAAASASTINVPAIAGYVSGTVTTPLISYTTASPNISGLTVVPPAGLFTLSVVDDGAGTINVTFGNRVPQTVVWRGTISSDWNTTEQNWVTQVGGIQTNYFDGDSVVFDNTVGAGPTTISVSSPVAPGQVFAPYGIVVSNASYTFSSGSVLGAATLLKTGTGTLTNDATFSPGVLLNQGALAGTGTVGPTRLQNGTTLTAFSGTVNGGLTSSNATATVTGTVNGGLNIQAGSLANAGTINGTISLATNVTLNNLVGANIFVTVPWSVPTNSVLVNNGRITQSGPNGQGSGLTVTGQLRGVGVITLGSGNSPDARVTLGNGGNLLIGNTPGEITNMTIAVRLDLLAGSTTTFDVNTATAQNDKIYQIDGFIQGNVNFGAGNSLGGNLVINKTAGPDFNLASTVHLFDVTANIPDNVAQAIPGVTPPPAPGLAWDVSRTISNLTVAVQGPAVITNSFSVSTNGVKSFVFDWPENYRGWRLERQTNTLAVGLAPNNGSNWVTIASSLGGSNTTFYPDTNNLSIRYFRSTTPVTDTNGAGLYPATFFRLTYP